MSIRSLLSLRFILLPPHYCQGRTTRQIAIDHPTFLASPFQPLPGFQVMMAMTIICA
jgi:hypothetical protein